MTYRSQHAHVYEQGDEPGDRASWRAHYEQSAGPLVPDATITTTKSASNPTFNFDGYPESIVKVGSTYYASYQGIVPSPRDIRLATATSRNGAWTEYGSNPVLTIGSQSWESAISNYGANAPEISEVDGTFYLFYSVEDVNAGSYGAIGVATATAATGPYTKYASNPILVPGGAGTWDSRRVGEPSVFYKDSVWYMGYMGETLDVAWQESEQIGYASATSPFGPWTKATGNPLIPFGETGTWDKLLTADPYLFFDSGYWWTWYTGGAGGFDVTKPWKAGLAWATDPLGGPWHKHSSNPVLSPSGTTWEQVASFRGSVWREGASYSVIYGGVNSAITQARGGNATLNVIGTGHSPNGTSFPSNPETNARFFRIDLGLEFYYDGSRWLTTTLYREPLAIQDALLPAVGTQGGLYLPLWNGDYDVWVEAFLCATTVLTTNDGTKYWTVALRRGPSATTLGSFNTSADAADTNTKHGVVIDALTGTTDNYLDILLTKTSTPGGIYAISSVSYRLVGP